MTRGWMEYLCVPHIPFQNGKLCPLQKDLHRNSARGLYTPSLSEIQNQFKCNYNSRSAYYWRQMRRYSHFEQPPLLILHEPRPGTEDLLWRLSIIWLHTMMMMCRRQTTGHLMDGIKLDCMQAATKHFNPSHKFQTV